MGKKLDKAVIILSKLSEVAHWIAAVSMIVVLILSLFGGTNIVQNVSSADFNASLSTYGFQVMVIDNAGQVNLTALRLFCVGAGIILSLMAMVFRNVYLIMKWSENGTPFQKDNVRMVREIGIFLIAIPILGLILSTIIRAAVGIDLAETSVELDSFLIGLVVLCLSRIFARGMALESDVDGLL